ncbi:MAG: hypothetical protein RLY43_268 [Bacteroidota bacterium]|jgi:hypothetical protein
MKKKPTNDNYFLNSLKFYFDILKEKLQEFDKKYPYTSQTIQLTFIYFFALVDLIYSVLNNIFSLGYLPEFIMPFFSVISGILQSPLFKLWASPEKVFFMSYVTLEFMVIRSTLNFSKFIKYNILLVFALLMLQGLAISCWDLLFHREITNAVANWSYDEGLLIGTNKKLAVFFFVVTFIIFVLLYYHFYANALKGKIATLPGLHWVTDSVAFWLRIKTPTMKLKGDESEIEETE